MGRWPWQKEKERVLEPAWGEKNVEGLLSFDSLFGDQGKEELLVPLRFESW